MTTPQITALQSHLQCVLQDAIRAEMRYMLEEDLVKSLPNDISMDDFSVSLNITVTPSQSN